METFAADATRYPPVGATDSIVDTPDNRAAGNISYVYWSFLTNKVDAGETWRNTDYFFPRILKVDDAIAVDPACPPADVPAADRWVATDFFRRGAPFPHARSHAAGLNVCFLDGHVALTFGKPKLLYR